MPGIYAPTFEMSNTLVHALAHAVSGRVMRITQHLLQCLVGESGRLRRATSAVNRGSDRASSQYGATPIQRAKPCRASMAFASQLRLLSLSPRAKNRSATSCGLAYVIRRSGHT